jgi:hypothetical protein
LNSDVLLAMSGTAAVVEPRRVEVDKNIPDHDISVTLRVLPKLQRYTGTIRHNLKSRQWGSNHDGMSIYVESVETIPRGEARAKGRGALKTGLFAYQDLRRRAIANEKHSSTENSTKHTTDDDQNEEPDASHRNRGVRKRIKMFQVCLCQTVYPANPTLQAQLTCTLRCERISPHLELKDEDTLL